MAEARGTVEVEIALKGLAAFQADFKRATQAISEFSVGVAAGAGFAGFSVAERVGDVARDLVTRFQELNIQVGRFSEIAGIAASEAAGMAYAAGQSDVEIGELSHGLKALAEWMQATGRGGENLKQVFLEQADLISRMPEGANRLAVAQERFGRAGADLIPLLARGSEELNRMFLKGTALSGVTDASVRSAKDLAAAWQDVNVATTSAVGSLTSKLGPIMAEMMQDFTIGLTKLTQGQKAANAVIDSYYPKPAQEKKQQGTVWTEQELAAQNKILDSKRDQLALDRERADLGNKGLAADRNFAKNLDSLDQEQILVQQKLVNAKDALAQKAITQQQFAEAQLAIGKELLALDVKRQEILVGNLKVGEQEFQQQQQALARRLASVDSDFTRTDAEKREAKLALIKAENEAIQAQIEAVQQLRRETPDAYAQGAYQPQLDSLNQQKAESDFRLSQAQNQANPNSFADQMLAAMTKLKSEWGTLAQQIADGFSKTVNNGISTVSSNLSDVILRTKTWAMALRDIGNTVMQELVQSIIQMGIQFVLSHVIMRAAMMATHAIGSALGWADVAQSNAQQAAKAPALAANAASASVSSYGTSAILGMAAAIAAIGLITAAAMGAFAEGGYTGAGGKWEPAGIVHRGEFVMPASAVNRIGLGRLEAMRQGATGSGGMMPMISAQAHHINVFDDRSDLEKHIRDNPEVQHSIIDLVKAQSHRIMTRRV